MGSVNWARRMKDLRSGHRSFPIILLNSQLAYSASAPIQLKRFPFKLQELSNLDSSSNFTGSTVVLQHAPAPDVNLRTPPPSSSRELFLLVYYICTELGEKITKCCWIHNTQVIMIDKSNTNICDAAMDRGNGCPSTVNPVVDFLLQFPKRIQNSFKTHFKPLINIENKFETGKIWKAVEKESSIGSETNLEKQLQSWKDNPFWLDQSPEVKVLVPKGSLCNLKLKFKVGLPPDAIYNIVIDPENKRVFKNIKEVKFRRVIVDDGSRQVVEVEQAALWRFLWLSGTISVHLIVDQNRQDHTVNFKLVKSAFMNRFEGCWKIEPLFVDEQMCHPNKPKTWAEYESCTDGKGRLASVVSLDQLIQPVLVPPPPFSWYLRGITAKTTEMLVSDLLDETARIRVSLGGADSDDVEARTGNLEVGSKCNVHNSDYNFDDIKKRWQVRRSERHRKTRRL